MYNYETYNEARKHKNRNKPKRNRGGGGGVDQWLTQQANNLGRNVMPNRGVVKLPAAPHGMPMKISERLEYILKKMSSKGNKIAKDFLGSLNKPDAKFDCSYVDLAKRGDSLSYLSYSSNASIPEKDKFDNNKRSQSKIYKVIKTIFGSKYTKFEVNKFVSQYKEVYNVGPPSDTTKPTFDAIKKITDDTKNDKLIWKIESSYSSNGAKEWIRLNSSVQLTPNKRLFIQLLLFPQSTEETKSLLTINLLNYLGKTSEERRKFICNYHGEDMIDLIRIIKEKFEINAR